ncbi:MAG: VTT domain-containing protein [Dehalococcoidia bacterium]|nr:VTT domain-containing protein [Dehalococcoidia bacterium]
MKEKPTKREAWVGGLSLAVTITLCIVVIYYRNSLLQVESYGYAGCFIISVLAGSTIGVPIPGLPVIFTMGGLLNPIIVGAIAGFGEAIGSIFAYLIGYGGNSLTRYLNNNLYTRFTNMIHNHGSKVVFFMSSVFNPTFYPFAVFLGTLHFGLLKFFLLTWAGRTIKGLTLAYMGYFGLRFVLDWFGISL